MRAAAIFSDHMVLQREKPIAVWGDGKDGIRVTVSLGGNRASATVQDGKWRVTLPPMPAATGLMMTVASGAVEIRFADIAVGEVWLCGGQSNMEYEIRNDKNGKALLDSLTADCGVRFYYTPKQRMIDDTFEAVERNTGWSTASPDASGAWSAVGLYFALEIAEKLGVTVGLIGCNWGGTSASAWMAREYLEKDEDLRTYLTEQEEATAGKSIEQQCKEYDDYEIENNEWQRKFGEMFAKDNSLTWETATSILGPCPWPGPKSCKNPYRPTGLYFLYYQGESDDHRPNTYETLLTELIACWRRDWADPELPFLNVQLPMFRYLNDIDHKHWCLIREAQFRVYRKLKNTGLAVLTDCGELDNIHPTDKIPVGHRLALQALAEVYGTISRADACPPMFRSAYANGSEMTVLLDYADDGFLLTGEPVGFELAGDDLMFRPAKAFFGKGFLTLTADGVPAPKYARYAWTNFMTVTVFGKNGLPMAPFRTDGLMQTAEISAEKRNTPSASMT